jgi:hypothetical protein
MRGEYLPLPPEAGRGEETPRALPAYLLWHANPIPANLQALIRRIARDNPTWGEERIANELRLKRGLRVSPRTVRKYLPKRFDRAPNHGIPSQRWVTFVHNHAKAVVACDFCTVLTASFRLLYVFVLMEHATRRILHGHVAMHPTTQWTIQLRESIPRTMSTGSSSMTVTASSLTTSTSSTASPPASASGPSPCGGSPHPGWLAL